MFDKKESKPDMKTYKDVISDCVPKSESDSEPLDESFLSSVTTLTSLSKTLQIAKRVSSKKIRTKRLHKLPLLRDDNSNLREVFQKLDDNLHAMNDSLNEFYVISKEDSINLSKLISINTFATRLFLNPTKRK